MMVDALRILGGIGLFLLGMIWLSDGLRGFVGQAMRGALTRFTRTPLSGAATGALTTAVLQSSSATTVTAVGFVSAGLLTFPQALGVIFGANVGTTLTGWLVAILGFKLDLGEIVMPLVFLGAVMRLFGNGRLAHAGMALGGFSLIFIGIDAMKAGSAAFEGVVTPDRFPGDSLFGRMQLVLIGAVITVVTQSSSAGVATALAALGAGAVSLPQAAAMVIGMDVGTTFTAALATLGGSTAARRTGLSHVIYNLCTGVMAFVLLGPYASLSAPMVERGDAQLALVLFHTGFNLLGLVLILPFAAPFARLVSRIVPERGPSLTDRLDRRLLRDPDAACDAALATIGAIVQAQSTYLEQRLAEGEARRHDVVGLQAISAALDQTRDFVDAIPRGSSGGPRAARMASAMHVMDHSLRLYFRCTQEQRIVTLEDDHRLRRLRRVLCHLVADMRSGANPADSLARLNRFRRILRKQRRTYREDILNSAAAGAISGEEAAQRIDALRWLHRVCYHLWRIQHHMQRIAQGQTPGTYRREAATDILDE